MKPLLVEFQIDPKQVEKEDGGQAWIFTIPAEGIPEVFFRIQSYDESAEMKHVEFSKLVGKKLRLTIESAEPTVFGLPVNVRPLKIRWIIYEVESEVSGSNPAEMHETFETKIGSVEIPMNENTGLPTVELAAATTDYVTADQIILKVVDNYNTVEVVEKATNQTWIKFRRDYTELSDTKTCKVCHSEVKDGYCTHCQEPECPVCHEVNWGTDGAHSNEFCKTKSCYTPKPERK
jgi:hypothetical protein